MVKCNKCNSELEEGMKFCFKCGAKVTVSRDKCPGCNTRIKKGMKFCFKCGTKIENPAIPSKKRAETKEVPVVSHVENGSLGDKFRSALSSFFEEEKGNKDKSDEDDGNNKDDEDDLAIDFGSISSKHIAISAVVVIILALGLTWYSLSNKAPGELPQEQVPEVRYYPKTNEAFIVAKDEKFVRENIFYGPFVDLVFAIPATSEDITEDLFNREKLSNVFMDVPYKNDVFLKDELPNDVNEMYPIFVRTPIPLNKTKEGMFISNKFKLDPIIEREDAKFLIVWGKIDEFPYGSINPIGLRLSRI